MRFAPDCSWVLSAANIGEMQRLYFTKEHLDDVVERQRHGGKRIMGFRVVDSLAPGPHVYVFKRDTPQTAGWGLASGRLAAVSPLA